MAYEAGGQKEFHNPCLAAKIIWCTENVKELGISIMVERKSQKGGGRELREVGGGGCGWWWGLGARVRLRGVIKLWGWREIRLSEARKVGRRQGCMQIASTTGPPKIA
ncbi:hypothetical protein Ancab_027961, partial [Ancistrocladus abbreviatus]